MNAEHVPQTCKWASATLLLTWPLWLDAWSWEWSCSSQGAYKPVMAPENCRSCSQWELREDEQGGRK